MKRCSLVVLLLVAAAFSRPLQGRDVSLSVDFAPAAVAASNKANELAKKGDLDGAIRYYDVAVKLDPTMYVAIYWRGDLYTRQHKWERAITDFSSALVACPSFILAAIGRADANGHLGRYDRALAELNQVISVRLRPHANALAHSTRAWLYATCPDPAFRNGKQAVEDANLACRSDSWDSWDYIDTLAAAYAEAGDYENAVKFEEKAIRKARDAKVVEDAQKRLALYRQHRPFHLAPP
jgi:tetratricopeptide (TPR) repeat protein